MRSCHSQVSINGVGHGQRDDKAYHLHAQSEQSDRQPRIMAPNFSSGGKAFFTLTLIFLVICGIFIGLRFVAMRISRRKFALDDGFILVAYVSVRDAAQTL